MKKTISLSEGEWKIMNCLWQESPMTITQLVAVLKPKTAWSKHTVISMLSRMEAKRAVYHEEGERAKQFYPAVRKEDIAAAETEDFLSRVYEGSLGLMVNSLVKEKALSKEEIEELYAILKKAEEENQK